MHSLLRKILSASLVFGLTALPTSAAPVAAPLGVVVVANQAQVGNSKAVNGSTVFQGDRLVTAEAGQLQVRFGGAQARFLSGSQAVVNRTQAGVNADLLSGSVILADQSGDAFSLTADQAVLRRAGTQAMIARVTRVSAKELLLSASEGALEVTYGGEVTTIQAGSSYRMLLNPESPEPPGGPGQTGTRAAGTSKNRAIFIVVGVAAATTGIALAVAEAGSSSSTPESPSVP